MMGFEKKFISLPNKSIVLSSFSRRCIDGHIQQIDLVKYCSCVELNQFKWEWKVSWCAWVNNSTSLLQKTDRQDRLRRQFRDIKLPTNTLKQVWKEVFVIFSPCFWQASLNRTHQDHSSSHCLCPNDRQKYIPACCHIKWPLSHDPVNRLQMISSWRTSYVNSWTWHPAALTQATKPAYTPKQKLLNKTQ